MTPYARNKPLTFHEFVPRFEDGSDNPRAYLERCLETIGDREPIVQALTAINEAGARAAADASAERWKAGQPLSPIDGMPLAIKDLLETRDMPTEMGCLGMKGNFPERDNTAVWALRQAGAVILAKAVTAELGGSQPGPTTNPFDPARTPGGSSSGSAAAVGANMVPAAIGTQVGGSIIRPAAYCGNFALKPTQGALNRGERMATSQSTHGPHANSLEDMWQVAIEIAKRCGGDRGSLALMGPDRLPTATRPDRLIVLETEGWAEADEATKAGFAQVLQQLADAGVALIRRRDLSLVEELEQAVATARAICNTITPWENRWYQRAILDKVPGGISERGQATLRRAEAMTPDAYHSGLLARQKAQLVYAAVASVADAAITLSCPGPAPLWSGDIPGQPLAQRPTGDFVFNAPSSVLFAPVVTLPLMSVSDMPVGVQLMGQQHSDARITGIGRWMMDNLKRVHAP
jgi:Asp-tRNA(Asn)/Glu-tRNA(Gln) amidotransferase A subunit family amidase